MTGAAGCDEGGAPWIFLLPALLLALITAFALAAEGGGVTETEGGADDGATNCGSTEGRVSGGALGAGAAASG